MNAALRLIVWAIAATIVLPAAAEDPPAEKEKQPADVDAAVNQGIRWLTRNPREFQIDQSLSFLMANNLISSGDLGIDVIELTPALRSQLNLAEGTGLVVTSAAEDSPGTKAGIKPHDVLTKVGAAVVGNSEHLAEALKQADGKPVKIELLRQGKPLTVEATPKSPWIAELVLTDVPVTVHGEFAVPRQDRYRIGVVLSEADDTLRAQVGLAAGEGLIVSEVYPDTPAAKAGIQVHDVMVILDGKRLSTVDAINAQIQEIKEREVELKLLRSGKEVTLNLAPVKEAVSALSAVDRQALTLWSAGLCPGQTQAQNCRSCHAAPHGRATWSTFDRKLLGEWIGQQPVAAGSPQEQIQQLKEQLAKMQQVVGNLEASLAASAAKDSPPGKDSEGQSDK